MGKVQTAEWYDNIYLKHGGISKYSIGHYAERNHILANKIAEVKPKRIVEVAAGCWHLASLCLEKIPDLEYYDWSDFSKVCVEESFLHLNKYFPKIKVHVFDVDKDYNLYDWNFDVFVSLSLEHVNNDIQILNILPTGTFIFLSFPSFDDSGHARYFKSFEELKNRYGDLLDIDNDFVTLENQPNGSWRKIIIQGKKK